MREQLKKEAELVHTKYRQYTEEMKEWLDCNLCQTDHEESILCEKHKFGVKIPLVLREDSMADLIARQDAYIDGLGKLVEAATAFIEGDVSYGGEHITWAQVFNEKLEELGVLTKRES